MLLVSCGGTVHFSAAEGESRTANSISLSNTGGEGASPIAFKVLTTAPSRYRVKPATGLLTAGEALPVQLILTEALPADLSVWSRDKFQIKSIAITAGSSAAEAWKHAQPEQVHQIRIRCTHSHRPNPPPHEGATPTHKGVMTGTAIHGTAEADGPSGDDRISAAAAAADVHTPRQLAATLMTESGGSRLNAGVTQDDSTTQATAPRGLHTPEGGGEACGTSQVQPPTTSAVTHVEASSTSRFIDDGVLRGATNKEAAAPMPASVGPAAPLTQTLWAPPIAAMLQAIPLEDEAVVLAVAVAFGLSAAIVADFATSWVLHALCALLPF